MERLHPQNIARWLHRLFEASLLFKGLLAAAESIAGLGLWFTPNAAIGRLVDWLTRHEIAQDPSDAMATAARRVAEHLPIETQHFYAIYLLSHGVLKLGMVILLALRVRWAYPAAMAVLAGFVSYQMWHWSHSHSLPLLMLSGLDLLMIWLVWREWRGMGHPETVA